MQDILVAVGNVAGLVGNVAGLFLVIHGVSAEMGKRSRQRKSKPKD